VAFFADNTTHYGPNYRLYSRLRGLARCQQRKVGNLSLQEANQEHIYLVTDAQTRAQTQKWYRRRFKHANKPLYIAGLLPSQEQARADHFVDLPPEISRSLTTYRLYKLFEPWTTHLFQMSWNSYIGQGRIIGGGTYASRASTSWPGSGLGW
jgi:hypothetical protein